MTPELRTVIELGAVAILMVLAFPFAELIRLNFLTPRFYQDPPRWRLAWRVGGGVLAINLVNYWLGSPATIGGSEGPGISLWLALAIHYVMAFQGWLFWLWAWRMWLQGKADKAKREQRDRERNQ